MCFIAHLLTMLIIQHHYAYLIALPRLVIILIIQLGLVFKHVLPDFIDIQQMDHVYLLVHKFKYNIILIQSQKIANWLALHHHYFGIMLLINVFILALQLILVQLQQDIVWINVLQVISVILIIIIYVQLAVKQPIIMLIILQIHVLLSVQQHIMGNHTIKHV